MVQDDFIKPQMDTVLIPEISVITVVRNGFDHIEETIRSVLRQKNELVEYIVIDGASDDGTVSIIEKYTDSIDYWQSAEDSGIYDAMNKGIAVARGRCIALLNCGDTYAENTLSYVMDEILRKDGRYFVIAGGIQIIDKNGRESDVLLVNQGSLNNKLMHMPLHHPAMFVSRTIYDDFGVYNSKLVICADYEFVLRILNTDVEIVYICRPITKMLSGGISDSAKTIITKLKESYIIRRKYSGIFYCAVVSIREIASFLKGQLLPRM